jgi:alkylation response protein AidB-like acyl-CoA dehydrogenase
MSSLYSQPQYEMVRSVVRDFAVNEVEPYAAEIDAEHKFPMEIYKKMAQCGITGLAVPEEFGGSCVGTDRIPFFIAIEELARVDLTVASILSINTGIPAMIGYHGSEEQKKKYLPRLVRDGIVTSFAMTEPGAGSDLGGIRTSAVRDGNDYVINGTKCFITGGGVAEVYIVIAVTDKALGLKGGFSSFIVEAGTPGFSVGKIEDKMGIRGSQTAELIFEDCRIPKENLIGKEGLALMQALANLNTGRIGTASQAIGLATGAYEAALKYAGERRQFGKTIDQFQGIQWYLAEMATKLEAARCLVYNAGYLDSLGKQLPKESAMAKLFATQVAREIVNTSLQIHGGYGFIKDYPIERMYRDMKILEIYEGTSEVMKNAIAASIIKKKPR